MRVFLVVICAAAMSLASCKKKPNYNRSTPDATLASFFKALNGGQLPGALDQFTLDPEKRAWQLRCQTSGCKKGSYQIFEPDSERSDYQATLIVDYEVYGHGEGRIMHGQRSPVRLVREGDRWFIVRFGEHRSGAAPAARDAGSDRDAGPDPGDGGLGQDGGDGGTSAPAGDGGAGAEDR